MCRENIKIEIGIFDCRLDGVPSNTELLRGSTGGWKGAGSPLQRVSGGGAPGTKIEWNGEWNSEIESGFRVIATQYQRNLETLLEYGLGVLDLIVVWPRSSSPECITTHVFGVLDGFWVLGELELRSFSVMNPNLINLLCLTLSLPLAINRVL